MPIEDTDSLGFFARRRAVREAEAASISAIKPLSGDTSPSAIEGDIDLTKSAIDGQQPTIEEAGAEVKAAATEIGERLKDGDIIGAAEGLAKLGDGLIDVAAAVVDKVENQVGLPDN